MSSQRFSLTHKAVRKLLISLAVSSSIQQQKFDTGNPDLKRPLGTIPFVQPGRARRSRDKRLGQQRYLMTKSNYNLSVTWVTTVWDVRASWTGYKDPWPLRISGAAWYDQA